MGSGGSHFASFSGHSRSRVFRLRQTRRRNSVRHAHDTRTTLRLFGLLPLYVKAGKLMRDSQGMDKILYAIAIVQCSFFATFQLLERAFLTDERVLPKRGLARMTGGVASMYKLAHRAWFLGIMCDFVQLMREAQIFFRRNHIDKSEITEVEAEKAAQWYYDRIRPLAWLPIGWHLSAWTEEGALGKGFSNLVSRINTVVAYSAITASFFRHIWGFRELPAFWLV
ncbi:hypothetical protein F5Y19DRAFT_472230 [Xylariaceae sp. FL1651]|nr:hypothetical protein F5Y19DRAFT_472230 [Xylariaceae sp. FL1651]